MCGVAREVKDRKKERIVSLCQSVVTTIEIFVGSAFFFAAAFWWFAVWSNKTRARIFFGALTPSGTRLPLE